MPSRVCSRRLASRTFVLQDVVCRGRAKLPGLSVCRAFGSSRVNAFKKVARVCASVASSARAPALASRRA
eukprot:1725088-Prymnesium_polylepis.1